MRKLIAMHWNNLLAGLWFRPTAIVVLFLVAGVLLTSLDAAFPEAISSLAYGGSAETATQLLATLAGSVIAMAAVVFSFTIVALQLVASQYTPRALREFLADPPTQTMAGAFVGVVAFCVWVLRCIRTGPSGETFVPGLSVTVANALGIGSLPLLLAFMHHLSQSLEVTTIMHKLHRLTAAGIDRLHQADGGESEPESWSPAGAPYRVQSRDTGFVQEIAIGALAADDVLAALSIEILVRPGDFVPAGRDLCTVWSDDEPSEDVFRSLRSAVLIDATRDLHQDPDFGIQQLADIAIKAMSPAINDPTTALTSVRYLGVLIGDLARRPLPPARTVIGARGAVIYAHQRRFEEYLQEGFSNVAPYCRNDARVTSSALDALVDVLRAAQDSGDRSREREIARAARDLLESALAATATEAGRRLIHVHAARFERAVH